VLGGGIKKGRRSALKLGRCGLRGRGECGGGYRSGGARHGRIRLWCECSRLGQGAGRPPAAINDEQVIRDLRINGVVAVIRLEVRFEVQDDAVVPGSLGQRRNGNQAAAVLEQEIRAAVVIHVVPCSLPNRLGYLCLGGGGGGGEVLKKKNFFLFFLK